MYIKQRASRYLLQWLKVTKTVSHGISLANMMEYLFDIDTDFVNSTLQTKVHS